ncbi:hypothetical protein PPL_07728 [Heterostelium album PN500]|uniref:Ankyrin repeat-containing protein n=1 Tax=Heterostelium pallidum (strain ATCC 26659 / Pp 5 / PN500) TaxID=670386 RepID=D3BGS6_HETP5|nr:hypothetical protein PPL_07728 [Heterostelium album PN500]EFA79310.1 hypothetical protein PPL_07728 [Heterostelium album PN500]|eukprot:XP_020431431.1 hypothetical protein PPL_07728 [Heterostelium album PN500]
MLFGRSNKVNNNNAKVDKDNIKSKFNQSLEMNLDNNNKNEYNSNVNNNSNVNSNNIIVDSNNNDNSLNITLLRKVLNCIYLRRYIFREIKFIDRRKYGLVNCEFELLNDDSNQLGSTIVAGVDTIRYYDDIWSAEWMLQHGYHELLKYRMRHSHNVQFNLQSVLIATRSPKINGSTLSLILTEHPEYLLPQLYEVAARHGQLEKLKLLERLLPSVSKSMIGDALNTSVSENQLEVLKYLVQRHGLEREHLSHANRRSFYKTRNAELIRYCVETLMNQQWTLELNVDLHLFYLCGDLELIKRMCNRVDANARHVMLIALEHYINDLLILPEYAVEFDHPSKNHIGIIFYIYQLIGFGMDTVPKETAESIVHRFQLEQREHKLLAIFYITLLQMNLHIYAQGIQSYNTIRKIVAINSIPLIKYIIEMPLKRSQTNNSILPIMFGAAVEIGTLELVEFLLPYHPWQYGLQVIGFGSAEIMKRVLQVVPGCQWHDLALERSSVAGDLELVSMLMTVDKQRGFPIAFTNSIVRGRLDSVQLLAKLNPQLAEKTIVGILQKKGVIITILDNFEMFLQYINEKSAKTIMELACQFGYKTVVTTLHKNFPQVKVNLWSAANGRQLEILEYLFEQKIATHTKSSWITVAEKGFIDIFELMVQHLQVPKPEIIKDMCEAACTQGKLAFVSRLSTIDGFLLDPANAISNGHLNIVASYINHWLKQPLTNKQLDKLIKVSTQTNQKLITEYLKALRSSGNTTTTKKKKSSKQSSKILNCRNYLQKLTTS